ncbi:MAG TPA: ATP-binding protein [Bacillota bacterium]
MTDITDKFRVPVDRLRRVCDPDDFDFGSTADVPPLVGMIGQERAVRAMEFGLRVRSPGYNIYMSGPPGTGKTTYAQNVAAEAAADQPVPNDWVYVHNFHEPDRPRAIALPPGWGRRLRADMERLIVDLREDLSKTFDSDHYEEQRQAVVRQFQERSEQVLEEADRAARLQGFALRRSATGFLTIPLRPDGVPMGPEEFNRLPDEVRAGIEERSRGVQAQVAEAVRRLRSIEQEARAELEQLERSVAMAVVGPLVEQIKERYRQVPEAAALMEHLDDVREDVLNRLDDFRGGDRSEEAGPMAMLQALSRGPSNDNGFARYRVNVVVDHSGTRGAPVVVEPHPIYYNLVGKQEYAASQGTGARTDHTMIKAGALHQANGGYLILQARDLLSSPGSWDALKRALKTREIRIEAMGEEYRMVPVRTIRPQPIPLDVKVILIGTPSLFYLLHENDEDFRKLFKIKADFDVEMPRDQRTMMHYAMFISSLCRREGLRHFDRGAVARVVEHASRLADDQTKITTRFNEVVEILYEAAAWADLDDVEFVGAVHVERAIEERTFRNNRIEEKVQEMIARGSILVATEGAVVGQINGLSVSWVGDHEFGRPSRITARTYVGDRGIVQIEREVELSGAVHDKGVMILSGYLGAQYAQQRPLSLSASITFEQLYEGVDGDSASSTELYALLSSLADVPLRQDLAVTGSVDQFGRIQPVGGVNEKIEGFYRACKARGLTGTQGVIIPRQNVDNLMLHPEVVEAVRDGRFHVYAVETIDQGLELLTGVPAGEPDEQGNFPPESIHGRVAARLAAFAEAAAEHGGGRRGGDAEQVGGSLSPDAPPGREDRS